MTPAERRFQRLMKLDDISHMLRLPGWVVCDRFEAEIWRQFPQDVPLHTALHPEGERLALPGDVTLD